MRVAAIDVGTNTTRLLAAEATPGGYRDLERRLVFTRLGEGVDAEGRIRPQALERTLAAVGELCAAAGELGVSRLRVAATSAVRDAANRDELLAGLRRLAGVEPEVLPGAEEARLSFLGATADLPPGRYLVCDIGGGSTELVVGTRAAGTEGAVSLDLGAVRLTERHLTTDPPEPAQLAEMEAAIDSTLAGAARSIPRAAAAFVGVAGTVTTLAALHLGLRRYDPEKVHGARLGIGDVARLYERLARMTVRQRARYGVLPEGRADVIVAGTAILLRALEQWSYREVRVSEKDILDGLVLEILEG